MSTEMPVSWIQLFEYLKPQIQINYYLKQFSLAIQGWFNMRKPFPLPDGQPERTEFRSIDIEELKMWTYRESWKFRKVCRTIHLTLTKSLRCLTTSPSRNVAKVVVYFQTMTLQEVTQQAAWTVSCFGFVIQIFSKDPFEEVANLLLFPFPDGQTVLQSW